MKQHRCLNCGEIIAVGEFVDPSVFLNRIANHMFVVHTLPQVEDLLRANVK